jgi:hypothetical protein
MLNKNADVRLWSREPRLPRDEIAPEHAQVHALLERWARANRERRSRATCSSVEKLYLRGGRDVTPASTAPAPAVLLYERVERVVLRLPSEHSRTILLYYVERVQPVVICRRCRLRFADFPRWIGTTRAMVLAGLGPCAGCRAAACQDCRAAERLGKLTAREGARPV